MADSFESLFTTRRRFSGFEVKLNAKPFDNLIMSNKSNSFLIISRMSNEHDEVSIAL